MSATEEQIQVMEPGQLRGAWTLTGQDLEDLTNIARLKNYWIENFRNFSDDDEIINKLESLLAEIFISLKKYWTLDEINKPTLYSEGKGKDYVGYNFSQLKGVPEFFRSLELEPGHLSVLLKICETEVAYWEELIRRLGVELPTTRDNPRKK
jgi:hypothetical protein